MKLKTITVGLALTVCFCLISMSSVAETASKSAATTDPPAPGTPPESEEPRAEAELAENHLNVVSRLTPVYVPPRLGAPKTRVGGGTRSENNTGIGLALLAPEHTGLTGNPSPTLYWWLSGDHDGVFEFVVMSESGVAPELRIRVDAPMTAGIHAIDLVQAGLALEPDVAYRWSVSIIRDESSRSRDIAAIASVVYVESSVSSRNPVELAASGLWYDAIELLSDGNGPSRNQRRMRAALLEQVDLEEVANWDRNQG